MSPDNSQIPSEFPHIISVDDHVLEPPDLWSKQLPTRYVENGPRVSREYGRLVPEALSAERAGLRWSTVPRNEEGAWADIWRYEDVAIPLMTSLTGKAAAGKVEKDGVTTFDTVREGAWKSEARMSDMALNHTDVSVCFPNVVPRFCGQTFLEAENKELALLCVQAYNDWMITEWCGGAARGHLIPLTIVPLWDPRLAAEEIRRCARLGSYAVSFTESPSVLGLPSLYSGEWDPLFQECEESGTTVCIHIGSSSRLATTGGDAPLAAMSALTFQYGMHSLIDVLLSGVPRRFPRLRIMYSEANVGWIPYVLERLDTAWKEYPPSYSGLDLPEPPSFYFRDNIYGCIVDDELGLALREQVGMRQICFETDFPHGSGSFPRSAETAARLVESARLSEQDTYDFLRGNAIRAFGLQRFGVSA
jgi:predicted TIM-barrel fold metal-dependent hydrolase